MPDRGALHALLAVNVVRSLQVHQQQVRGLQQSLPGVVEPGKRSAIQHAMVRTPADWQHLGRHGATTLLKTEHGLDSVTASTAMFSAPNYMMAGIAVQVMQV